MLEDLITLTDDPREFPQPPRRMPIQKLEIGRAISKIDLTIIRKVIILSYHWTTTVDTIL
jgi:hypothetical protein